MAHPFSGKPENVEKVQAIILKLLHKYPDCTFYSPLHATGFFYYEFTYAVGMEHCYEALKRCDELWLCKGWEESRGCKLEVDYACNHRMTIRLVSEVADG